jgi:hypothetical protein
MSDRGGGEMPFTGIVGVTDRTIRSEEGSGIEKAESVIIRTMPYICWLAYY